MNKISGSLSAMNSITQLKEHFTMNPKALNDNVMSWSYVFKRTIAQLVIFVTFVVWTILALAVGFVAGVAAESRAHLNPSMPGVIQPRDTTP